MAEWAWAGAGTITVGTVLGGTVVCNVSPIGGGLLMPGGVTLGGMV